MYNSAAYSSTNRKGVLQLYKCFFLGIGFLSAILFLTIYYNSSHHVEWKQLLKIKTISEEEGILDIAKKHPNLPVEYWMKIRDYYWTFNYNNNMSCAMFPNLLELNMNQVHWQALYLPNTTVQLFSAHYDTREITSHKSVRVLAMIDKNKINFKLYCHVWYNDDKQPFIVEARHINYIQMDYLKMQKDGDMGPYLIECNLNGSKNHNPPVVVSIVEKPCDLAKNMLKVHYDFADEQDDFAVCVKGLDYHHDDKSARLVEWMELLIMMGANKVFLYELTLHPNMRKVVSYYQGIGKADLRSFSLPEGQMNIPVLQHIYLMSKPDEKRLVDLIPLNDCLYRNMYKYKYVVFLDIDEMIVPKKDENWPDLLERLQFKMKNLNTYASYNVRNVYFLDSMMQLSEYKTDIPQDMHMLQHYRRGKDFSEPRSNVRAFFDTRYVLTASDNLPLEYSKRSEFTYDIPTDLAALHHYTDECPDNLNCKQLLNNAVTDYTIWRFKDKLRDRFESVLKEIEIGYE